MRAVADQDAYVNLALPPLLRDRNITGRDAAFATELTHGTVRRQLTYDAIIDALASTSLDPPVRDVLRLGAHQLLMMRTPAHACVATSVELVRRNVGERPAGLVNAVLRRVSTRPLPAWVEDVAPRRSDDALGHLAVAHSHPRWIVAALRDALHADPATDEGELEALLKADNQPPRVTLVARPGRASAADLIAAGAEPGRWSPFAAILSGGDPGALPAVRDADAGVQDEGSQLVAWALGRAVLEGRDERWLDVCAGPGGKSALLAGLAAQRSAQLLAGDRLFHRAALVQRAVAGTPDVLGVVVTDGTSPAWRDETFDRVLVDAPCTGLGALRRRPEARWRRRATDIGELVPLQRSLLDAAVRSTRVGGVVAYVTCSPHVAETRGVVDAVLAERDDAVEEDARALLSGIPAVGGGPHLQLWPHRHGTDAMFLALLRRVQH